MTQIKHCVGMSEFDIFDGYSLVKMSPCSMLTIRAAVILVGYYANDARLPMITTEKLRSEAVDILTSGYGVAVMAPVIEAREGYPAFAYYLYVVRDEEHGDQDDPDRIAVVASSPQQAMLVASTLLEVTKEDLVVDLQMPVFNL